MSNFNQLPWSPARATTPTNSTVSLTMSHYLSSPGTFSNVDDVVLSSPEPQVVPRGISMRAKRGRPPKNQYFMPLDPSHHDAKRVKTSVRYPCPDCDNILPADRWSEHARRVHFPSQVSECPKLNERSRKPCGSAPFLRSDNFGTHLRREHGCDAKEVSKLKASCTFWTKNLFHHICGFCNDPLDSRDESIEHIKNHFKEISERPNPPSDLGVSEWMEQCTFDHNLKRGVNYAVPDDTEDVSDQDNDQDRDDGSSGSGKGNSDILWADKSSNQHNGAPGQSDYTSDNHCDFYGQFSTYTTDLHAELSNNAPHVLGRFELADQYQYPRWIILSLYQDDHLTHRDREDEQPRGELPMIVHIPSREIVTEGSHSLHPIAQHESYPYPTWLRRSVGCLHHFSVFDEEVTSKQSEEMSRCTCPACGKVYKDMKAHMLSHQSERPEKCPIKACDYHMKGFARKYDRNRHVLTHSAGHMACGFCPGSGTAAEKAFSRVDLFKRHLTSIHGVDEISPINHRRTNQTTSITRSNNASDAPAKCSICSLTFRDAQGFYGHLDDCVLRKVLEEHPLEAVQAKFFVESEQACEEVHHTLPADDLPISSNDYSAAATAAATAAVDYDYDDDEDLVFESYNDSILHNTPVRTGKIGGLIAAI